MIRPGTRRATALLLLAALLFMQGALAAQGCFVLQALSSAAYAAQTDAHEPDCHGAAPADTQVCFSHCLQADQALAAWFDHQELAPPVRIALRPELSATERVCAGPAYRPDPGGGPPHRILHCSLRN